MTWEARQEIQPSRKVAALGFSANLDRGDINHQPSSISLVMMMAWS